MTDLNTTVSLIIDQCNLYQQHTDRQHGDDKIKSRPQQNTYKGERLLVVVLHLVAAVVVAAAVVGFVVELHCCWLHFDLPEFKYIHALC